MINLRPIYKDRFT